MKILGLLLLLTFQVEGAFNQGSEIAYLSNFDKIISSSYSAVDDTSSDHYPADLIRNCKNSKNKPVSNVVVTSNSQVITASSVSAQCGANTICIVPAGIVLEMDTYLNVGALIIKGSLVWKDETQSSPSQYLCAGYIVMEDSGSFIMNLQEKNGWIYIKDNGAVHPVLRTRAFGASGTRNSLTNPFVDIQGREMIRTWSLLSEPFLSGESSLKLLHNPSLMGWRVGDRIGISPTKDRSTGFGQTFYITRMNSDGTIFLSNTASNDYAADFVPPLITGGEAALKSAEVVNLSRNIIVTGDDFSHLECSNELPEAVPGEETSTEGCRCSGFRTKCTVGLHTGQMNGGVTRIQNARIEKCGQRGIEGKYCLHFHKLQECPACLYKNNVVENSHQRGIIVHGTHQSVVEGNVLYDVRGAGLYIEDGNEMWNSLLYNVIICPWPLNDANLHGCTVPGTSNRIADTSDNQSGIFSLAATNNLIGNRVGNSFNGMFLQGGGIGRGESYGKVCTSDAKIGRLEGNTFHGHGRFGTYTLFWTYPKITDQSIASNGHNNDQTLCKGFNDEGNTRGLPVSFKNNFDYQNSFVGHYEAGDVQYNGHHSYNNLNLIYWKETKNFENGCSAHISGGHYASGNMALPDQGTFIIENTIFGNGVSLEPNHHCNVGTTGILCMPQYVLHNVQWKNNERHKKWVTFQSQNNQGHNANQMHGGIFTLSPDNANIVMEGGQIENSFFPNGFVSLVSDKFSYLLAAPNEICVLSASLGSEYGNLYDNGILCKVPLRALKIYTRNLVSRSAQRLKVRVWFNALGLNGQNGAPDVEQEIGFHQAGDDNASRKQGYSLPVIPGIDKSYSLSLSGNDGKLPLDWVVEFSDTVMGNRFSVEYIYLSIQGRSCSSGGLISSQHDRKFIWSGDEFMDDLAWGKHGACVGDGDQPEEDPLIDCSVDNNGVIDPPECSELCSPKCNSEHSYCDCGTGTCRCKPGFSGNDCSIDLCAAARCGEHGTCSARYLGSFSSLPVTSDKACICDEGWSGPLCDKNPCFSMGTLRDCSGHGTCVPLGDLDSTCVCELGFSGEECETSCDGFCQGSYPYNCAESVPGKTDYGCSRSGGCYYLGSDEKYPFDGFCTYKSASNGNKCQCKSNNDCMVTGPCRIDGSCPDPEPVEDGTPCNSSPWGICNAGVCIGKSSYPPNQAPTLTPSNIFTNTPTKAPASGAYPCTCVECTNAVLNTMAGSYSCGDRINWLQTEGGGSYTEEAACKKVSNEEFAEICGPMCDPDRCGKTLTKSPSPSPTDSPTRIPSLSPTIPPTRNPSQPPSNIFINTPTKAPTSGAYPCTCVECTDDVLNTMAGSYSCGDRINWLQTEGGGSYTEEAACKKVSNEEFAEICGPMCDPDQCGKTRGPITVSPTFTPKAPSEDLYCFPPGNERVTYTGIWNKYTIQVKEGQSCGPGNNKFSRNTVSVEGDDLILWFKEVNGIWEASEVRISLPEMLFSYGTYSFSVKSVDILDSGLKKVSNILPADLVLGLFTWDPTDRYDVHENYNHEVDIEMSRWGVEDSADMQFLMQPPGHPQQYRFFSGEEATYDQSMQIHSFTWLPGIISWESSSGGGQTHIYETENAVKSDSTDYIQCLPADVEIRINLWNMNGPIIPKGINEGEMVKVVIDNFSYIGADESFVMPGGYCSKHCQCQVRLGCVNGQCIDDKTGFRPTESTSIINTLSPSASTTNPSCEEKKSTPFLLKIKSKKNKRKKVIMRRCRWLRKQSLKLRRKICKLDTSYGGHAPVAISCPVTCGNC